MKRLSSLVLGAAALGSVSSGCFVQQRDHDALAAKTTQMEQELQKSRVELQQTRSDLEATRQRLDNALRASADSSSDLMSSKQRLNELVGRLDEVQHGADDTKRDLGATRTEIYARLDELKRAQQPPPPVPPPITAPVDKATHWKQVQDAYAKKDWATVRSLGTEYFNRYPADDYADEALFTVGDSDLQDGRPSSALAQFNRLLKLFPRSAFLDRTLFDMGEAYLLMHDCANAKLAFEACEKRSPKVKPGTDAKAKLSTIAQKPPGLCAPPS